MRNVCSAAVGQFKEWVQIEKGKGQMDAEIYLHQGDSSGHCAK